MHQSIPLELLQRSHTDHRLWRTCPVEQWSFYHSSHNGSTEPRLPPAEGREMTIGLGGSLLVVAETKHHEAALAVSSSSFCCRSKRSATKGSLLMAGGGLKFSTRTALKDVSFNSSLRLAPSLCASLSPISKKWRNGKPPGPENTLKTFFLRFDSPKCPLCRCVTKRGGTPLCIC